MAKKKIPLSLSAALILTLAGAILLSLESQLAMQGKSLCKTRGCEIVGQYLRLGEPFLIAGGAAFLWLLALMFFFAIRYPRRLISLPLFALMPALAFDGALIGFQVFTIEQTCLICFGVAALLVVITLLYSISRKNLYIIIVGVLIWTGGFTANSIMIMPKPSGAYHAMSIVRQQAVDQSIPARATMTMVFSVDCPACLDVVSYLADNPIPEVNWHFASVDRSPESLRRLGYFLALAENSANIFKALEQSKTKTVPDQIKFNPAAIKKHNEKTLSFLANMGINTVPVLIIEHSDSRKEIISGREEIIQTLASRK